MFKRFLVVTILAFLTLSFATTAHAQLLQISSGLGYLSASQNADGTWDTYSSQVDTTAATVSVIETLKLLNQTAGSSYATGSAWLQAQSPQAVDHIARRIQALNLTDGSANALVPLVNPGNGAWGGYDGFDTDLLDTALALQALNTANYAALTVINPALAFITNSQNADGGWGFCAGEGSNVYMTAVVTATLERFPQVTTIATAVGKATNYLLANQNGDGGFGGAGSSVYETALAYTALAGNGKTQGAPLQNAVNFLSASQSANGSWNDDPYSTALAIKALFFSENKPSPPPPPPAAGTITGTVVDAVTKAGVSGVSVVLASNSLASTTTDASGNFTLHDAPAGSQSVVFSLSGYASKSVSAGVTVDTVTNLGTVPLLSSYSTGTIAGTITDASGQPVAGVAVSVTGAWSGSATTGGDGSYSFSYVLPGQVTISAAKPGYQIVSGSGTVFARTTLSFSPRLSSSALQGTTGTLVGRVVDSYWGLPIGHLPEEPGVKVGVAGFVSVSPDDNGYFSIPGLAPGTYNVLVGMDGFATRAFRVSIPAGVTFDLGTVALEMSVAKMALTGKVTDAANGAVIEGAEVTVAGTDLTSRSDVTGIYAVAGIDVSSQITLKAAAAGYASRSFAIKPSPWTHTIDMALTPTVSKVPVSGTVIDAATAQPLPGVTLTLASDGAIKATTGTDGTFAFSPLQTGLQRITVALDGYSTRTMTTTVAAGIVNNVGKIALSANPLPASIQGTAWDMAVKGPFAGVEIQATGTGTSRVTTAADGTYKIDDVHPGTVTVATGAVPKTGYFDASVTAPLDPGGILVFNPALYTSLPAVATVSVSTDKPVYATGERVGLAVNLQNMQGLDYPANLHLRVTDPAGAVAYDGVQAVDLAADSTVFQNVSFALPASTAVGSYAVKAELYGSDGVMLGNAVKAFGVATSQISVTPILPATIAAGDNRISFTLVNSGSIAVSTGVLTATLTDPEGQTVWTGAPPFSLAVGESKTFPAVVSLPALKFGTYTLSFTESDESGMGQPTQLAVPNTLAISALFDDSSHRVRQTAGLTVTLNNTGRFALDAAGGGASVTVSVPDAGYLETKTLSALPAAGSAGSSLAFSFPIPATVNPGEHAGTVTVTLPSGSTTVQKTQLAIQESSLALAPPQPSYTAGGSIGPVISNSGGVDTSVQYNVTLYDARSTLIAQTWNTGTAIAGSTLALALGIPSGAVDGTYNLVVDYKDLKTGKEQVVPNSITINGVKGTLQVQTDKQAYLLSEAITGLGTVATGGTVPVQNGNLHLQVTAGAGTQMQKTWTTQADFQTGVRNGVDTYGVNDWMIPDDDFDAPTIDTNKWSATQYASIQSGTLFLDTTRATSSTQVSSRWYLDGDFDLQVDLVSNNPTDWTGAGLNIADSGGTVSFGIGNNKAEGYGSRVVINHVEMAKATNGIVATSGKFRITRTSSTVVTYYWADASWRELLRYSSAALTTPCKVNFGIYRDPNYPGATAAFDNLKVNGRVLTENQTVDSVRLLPLNDNFDDGVLNEDRWRTFGAKGSEAAGALHLSSNAVFPQNGVTHKANVTGDFSAASKFKNFAATPSKTTFGQYSMHAGSAGLYAEIYSDAVGQSLIGMSSVSGNFQQVATGPYNNNSGTFRLSRTGSTGNCDYWDGSKWVTIHSRSGISTNPMAIEFQAFSGASLPSVQVDVDNYSINSGTYAKSGTINLKYDSGITSNKWDSLQYSSSLAAGTSIQFRTRTSETAEGLAGATWSDYITASGSPVTSPAARWIEIEGSLATTNPNVTPLLNDVTVVYTRNAGDVLWQTDLPVNLVQQASSQVTSAIGSLGVTGKLFLGGTLTSTTGQTVTTAAYPFYVEQGDILLLFTPDKKIYRPGETVTVTGSVSNRSTSTDAAGLALQVKGASNSTLYSESLSIPANGTHPFSFTTTAGNAGSYLLTATVTQNSTTLADISDQYQSVNPVVSADLSAPDVAANAPFGISVSVTNSGSVDATTGVRIADDSGKVIDDQAITLAAGESRVISYTLSITGNATYTAVFSGDFTRTISKTVTFTPIPGVVSLSPKITADKISYNPNEQVTLNATVSSDSAVENLSALVTVANSRGEGVYRTTYAIPLLNQGQIATYKSYWNTGSFPAGTYTVNMQIMDVSGTVVGRAGCNLTINSPVNAAALIRANLSLDRQNLLSGDIVTVSYNVTNAGNVDLTDIPLSIQTVAVADQVVYDAVAATASLAIGSSTTGSVVIDTGKYGAKDYLVALTATVGGVPETVAGSYFRIEGAPTMPALSAPGNGADVGSLTPALSVSNASDPNNDSLSYHFELYRDSGLTALVASGVAYETQGTTSWTPPPLQENATYYWRARSYDGQLYSPWMAPASFRVNTVNDPPTAPTVSSPADGGSVAVLTPAVTVSNATDPDSTGLTYDFEIALDAEFTQVVASESGIAGGDGTTSWTVPLPLQENGTYYWRARADDWLIQGPWSQPARLFVNTANDAPSAPVILTPQAGTTVAALAADVAIANSTDPDSTTLSYLFEADTVPSFDSSDIVRSGNLAQGDGTTTWHLSGLKDNTHYYLRVKASDGLAESPWSKVSGFFANTVNDAPTVPIPANPSTGAGVTVFNPTLEVRDSTDPDGDPLSYEFEIYSDAVFQNQVAQSGRVDGTAEVTGWQVPVALVENQTYYWRARAFDGALYSEWSQPGSFMVNTANDAPFAPALSAPAQGSIVGTLAPVLSVVNATDPEGDALSYDFELYSGGSLVASGTGVPGDASGVTSWTPKTALVDDTQYQWRARAFDGESYGPWMTLAGFTVHLPHTNIAATVNFDPDTLSRTGNGTWVSVYIELPAGYSPADIDVASIRLQGSVPAEIRPVAIGDHDKDGIPDLMVKFKRSQALGVLPDGDRVPVEVSGKVGDVTFDGVDFIRVSK